MDPESGELVREQWTGFETWDQAMFYADRVSRMPKVHHCEVRKDVGRDPLEPWIVTTYREKRK